MRPTRSRFPRVLGALTAAYGVFALARPDSLTRHAELGDPADPPRSAVLLSRGLGARDLVSGVALMALPHGRPLQAAVAARVACDSADAIGFGVFGRTPRARAKIAAVAVAWALLCASAWPAAGDGT